MVRFSENRWHMVRFCKIQWELVMYGEIHWDLVHSMILGDIWWDMGRFCDILCIEIWWDLSGFDEILWGRFYEIWWHSMRCGEIQWHMVRFSSKYGRWSAILDIIKISKSPTKTGTMGCRQMQMEKHIWVTGNHSKSRCPLSQQGQGGGGGSIIRKILHF